MEGQKGEETQLNIRLLLRYDDFKVVAAMGWKYQMLNINEKEYVRLN